MTENSLPTIEQLSRDVAKSAVVLVDHSIEVCREIEKFKDAWGIVLRTKNKMITLALPRRAGNTTIAASLVRDRGAQMIVRKMVDAQRVSEIYDIDPHSITTIYGISKIQYSKDTIVVFDIDNYSEEDIYTVLMVMLNPIVCVFVGSAPNIDWNILGSCERDSSKFGTSIQTEIIWRLAGLILERERNIEVYFNIRVGSYPTFVSDSEKYCIKRSFSVYKCTNNDIDRRDNEFSNLLRNKIDKIRKFA
jgi:hypothetical protein